MYMNMQINKVRELLGELPTEMPGFLSDATIRRFLHAKNWSVVQATKTLKEAVKWRRQYKPEKICWVSIVIAHRGCFFFLRTPIWGDWGEDIVTFSVYAVISTQFGNT